MKAILLEKCDNCYIVNAFSHFLVPAVATSAWNVADVYIRDVVEIE